MREKVFLNEVKSEDIYQAFMPVFWAYGLAVFHAQSLERSVRLLFAVIVQERGEELSEAGFDISALLKTPSLRNLFNNILEIEDIPGPVEKMISDTIDDRNALVHSSWNKNVKDFRSLSTIKGREQIYSDFLQLKDQFREADRIVTALIDKYLSRHGMSIDTLSAPFFEKFQNDLETLDNVPCK